MLQPPGLKDKIARDSITPFKVYRNCWGFSGPITVSAKVLCESFGRMFLLLETWFWGLVRQELGRGCGGLCWAGLVGRSLL